MARKKKAEPATNPEAPPEPEGSNPWFDMWDKLVAIELVKPTYACPESTSRASATKSITPVFEGKTPLGVIIQNTDRRTGREDPRTYFIDRVHIKEYQFGEKFVELTHEDQEPAIIADVPLADQDDAEILTDDPRRKPTKPTKPRKPKNLDEPEMEPDDAAIDQMAEMAARMRQAEADEAEYERVQAEVDEEVLEDEPGA